MVGLGEDLGEVLSLELGVSDADTLGVAEPEGLGLSPLLGVGDCVAEVEALGDDVSEILFEALWDSVADGLSLLLGDSLLDSDREALWEADTVTFGLLIGDTDADAV